MIAPDVILRTIKGKKIERPEKNHYIHLQFRRFSGCPVCMLHVQQLLRRRQDIENANIHEVIIFYSTEEKMSDLLADLPFDYVADPKRKLYAQFGVDTKLRSILSPLALPWMLQAVFSRLPQILRAFPSKGETLFGLPADFLIDSDWKIVGLKYGKHVHDHWDVDTLLKVVSRK